MGQGIRRPRITIAWGFNKSAQRAGFSDNGHLYRTESIANADGAAYEYDFGDYDLRL